MPSDVEDESKTKSQGDSTPVDKTTTSEKDLVRRRTKTGCLTCRKRRIKCGEEHPICKNCIKSKRDCAGYNHPLIYKQHPPLNSRPSNDFITTTGLSRQDVSYSHRDTSAHSYSTVQHVAATTLASSFDSRQYRLSPWIAPNTRYTSQLHQIHVRHSNPTASEYRAFQWHEPLRDEASSFDLRTTKCIDHADTLGVFPLATEHIAARSDSASDGLSSSEPILLRPPTEPVYNDLGFVRRSALTEILQQPTTTVLATNGTSSFLSDAEDSDDPWDVDLEYNDEDLPSSNPNNSINGDHRSGISSSTLDLTSNGCAPLVISRQHTRPNSPLFEERFRHVFTHFITITGLRISALNRHDVSNNNDLSKNFWTQNLPTMATERPALAHAILALSAVHMAKLNIGSENTALKHFTWALKRIGPVLGDSQRRHEVSTLATILLLGFYEVVSGDHARWSLHLSGAGKLIMEHDYTSMMRAITVMRRSNKAGADCVNGSDLSEKDYNKNFINKDVVDALCNSDWDVDQELVSRLIGTEVNYSTQSQRHPHSGLSTTNVAFGSLENWRAILELYWWYCRQSVYMSMLSGDRPLLPYSQWKFCPPRGSINDANKPHATFDHLWLIIARLTDFGGRDRERKIAVMKSQGGQWIPAPGFLGPRPSIDPNPSTESATHQTQMKGNGRAPSANEGRTRKTKPASGPSATQPTFYGMIPPPLSPVKMPPSYRIIDAQLNGNSDVVPEHSETAQPQDLDIHTQQALHEHSLITTAFDEFEAALGTDFQPLSITDIQISTPFGPALQYKSPMIATMWTFFNAGRILLRRMHPHSPPAAMMAAGVNAHVTHEYAQTVGKICGGLFAQHSYLLRAGHVDHFLSAAVMEVTLSLLFAAIQYQTPVQRGWTISKLNEIAQVIGWPTSAAVAAGCETFWTEAGLAGKGPPYIRTMDRNNGDERVNGKYRLPDYDFSRIAKMTPDEEHVSRFVNHDRHLIDKHTSTRAHWALGLLSVDEDLQRMSMDHT